jgi:hypothetical protein
VCCQVEVSAAGWSLVQMSPTGGVVSNWVWSWILGNEEAPIHSGQFRYGKKKDQLTFCVLALIIELYTRLGLSVLPVTSTEGSLYEYRYSKSMLHSGQVQMLKNASPIGPMKHHLNSLPWQASNRRASRIQGLTSV